MDIVKSYHYPNGSRLAIIHGNILEEQVDAIVNAANSQLKHGGGLAAAIVRSGGKSIQEESDRWVKMHGEVSHAIPAITSAGKLPSKFIIHAVGPIWGEGNEEEKLQSAIWGVLQTAEKLNLKSISIPPISTGIFRFPKDIAAKIIYETLYHYFEITQGSSLISVHLTIIDQATLDPFLREFEKWQK